jgi:hypothetical protein
VWASVKCYLKTEEVGDCLANGRPSATFPDIVIGGKPAVTSEQVLPGSSTCVMLQATLKPPSTDWSVRPMGS